MTDQVIKYENRSNGITTTLDLIGENGAEINYSNLMSAIHQIEHLVGYCGTFSLHMVSPDAGP